MISTVHLTYDLVPENQVDFDNALPLHLTTPEFDLEVKGNRIEVDLKGSFPSLEDARATVEPLLRSWEVGSALHVARREFWLKLSLSSFSADDEQPNSSAVIEAASATMSTDAHVSRGKYPDFPSGFRASPLVESLWHRFEGYRAGREPLLSMAYFSLTLLEMDAGGNHAAADAFRIEESVLDKLGELTSTRGDHASARKMSPSLKSLADSEALWVVAAVRAIIWRVGEVASGLAPVPLSKSDLPPL